MWAASALCFTSPTSRSSFAFRLRTIRRADDGAKAPVLRKGQQARMKRDLACSDDVPQHERVPAIEQRGRTSRSGRGVGIM